MSELTKTRMPLAIPIQGARPWKGIVWHHSASPDGKTRDWDGIVKYHTSFRIDFNIVTKEEFEKRQQNHQGKVFQKPWQAVGYNGGTELIGGVPAFNWGRPLSMVGAHAGVENVSNVFNTDYLGFCCIGNYDAESPSPDLWEFNLQLTRAFMDAFHISRDQIIGHREVYKRLNVEPVKSCPGKSWNMDLFRAEL
jgi:N-acetylmuramoyl-L-alanine amidase